MRIRLRFFAALREQMGARGERSVKSGATVGTLWRALVAERPELAAVPVRFAVNETYVAPSHRLDQIHCGIAGDVEAAVPASGLRLAPRQRHVDVAQFVDLKAFADRFDAAERFEELA